MRIMNINGVNQNFEGRRIILPGSIAVNSSDIGVISKITRGKNKGCVLVPYVKDFNYEEGLFQAAKIQLKRLIHMVLLPKGTRLKDVSDIVSEAETTSGGSINLMRELAKKRKGAKTKAART